MKAVEEDPDREAWLEPMRSYADDLIAAGDYPNLAEFAGADPNPLEIADELFDTASLD